MPAVYPATLPVRPASGVNLSTNPHSSLHNNSYDEIVAIATELGTAPKGTFASVKARLDALPAGRIGYAQITADFGGFVGTTLTITGLEFTWTAVAGRRYRTTISGETGSNITGDVVSLTICNAANVTIGRYTTPIITGSVNQSFEKSIVETGLSGSTTRRLRGVRAAGTGTCDVKGGLDRVSHILIEDIGPT